MVWEANKYEVDKNGFSIRLHHPSGKDFWFDLWFLENKGKKELLGDWNQYIFYDNEDDTARQEIQSSSRNFGEAMDCAINYLIAKKILACNYDKSTQEYVYT